MKHSEERVEKEQLDDLLDRLRPGQERSFVVSSLVWEPLNGTPLEDVEVPEQYLHEASEWLETDGALGRAAHIHEYQGNLNKAIKLHEQEGELKTAARVAIRAGQIDVAISLYVQEGSEHALETAANLAKNNGRLTQAADLFKEAGNFWSAGYIYNETGDLEQAVDTYKEGNLLAHAAEIQEKQGKYLDAIISLIKNGRKDKFRNHMFDGFKEAYNLAKEHELLGESMECFAEEGAFWYAGVVAEEIGLWDEAIDYHLQNPTRGTFCNSEQTLLSLAKKMGRSAEIAEYFTRESNHWLAARAAEDAGNIDMAIEHFLAYGEGGTAQAERVARTAGKSELAEQLYQQGLRESLEMRRSYGIREYANSLTEENPEKKEALRTLSQICENQRKKAREK